MRPPKLEHFRINDVDRGSWGHRRSRGDRGRGCGTDNGPAPGRGHSATGRADEVSLRSMPRQSRRRWEAQAVRPEIQEVTPLSARELCRGAKGVGGTGIAPGPTPLRGVLPVRVEVAICFGARMRF
jgi:hypothetical protein